VERGFAIVGFAATAAAGLAVYSLYSYRKDLSKLYSGDLMGAWQPTPTKLPKEFLLHLDLDQTSIVDAPPLPRWGSFLEQGTSEMTLRSVVQTIEDAAKDDRVKGFVTTGCGGLNELGSVQELRSAVRKFCQARKKFKSVFYTDTFGEAMNKTLAYYFASAFDRIYMQPSGRMTATGYCLEFPFFKNLLDRWNVDFRVWAKEDYKTAFNFLTHDSFTEQHEQQLKSVMNGIFDQMAEGIAEGRGLTKQQVEDAISAAPLTSQQALEAGLIDQAVYKNEMWDLMTEKKEPLEEITLRNYQRIVERERKKIKTKKTEPEVMVMHMSGLIQSGWGPPVTDKPAIWSGQTNQRLQDLSKNQNIKAVVLRVNSGGGSAVASDTIRKQIADLKATGKYVVVSMGNVAASGGYYISLGANSVVANPGTLTGSIGVITASPFLKDALDQHGVNVALLKRGENADLLSPFTAVTPKQEVVIEKLLDDVYSKFLHHVQTERNLTPEVVRSKARGMVWLGKDAVESQLVDELGGLSEAIEIAKRGASLPPDARVEDYATPHRLFDIVSGLMHQFRTGDLSRLVRLRSSIEMYSFEADVILGSIQ